MPGLMLAGRNVQVDDYEPADYVEVAGNAYGWLARAEHRPDPVRLAETYHRDGVAFTARWAGEILVTAGLIIPWPGCAHAWAIVTPAGLRHPVMVHRTVRRFLAQLIRRHRLRRVEATVIGGEGSHRWIRALGFSLESTKPDWGPRGETGHVYARLTRFTP